MSTVYKHVKNNHSTKSEKQTQDEIIIHQLSPSQIGEIDENLMQNVVINIDNKIVENISIEEKRELIDTEYVWIHNAAFKFQSKMSKRKLREEDDTKLLSKIQRWAELKNLSKLKS